MEARDEYVRLMEAKWPMLCYCNNHWKAYAIVTTNYPTWYCGYIRREVGLKDDDKGCDEPVMKRCKMAMEEASNSESSPPPLKCRVIEWRPTSMVNLCHLVQKTLRQDPGQEP